jgi:AcrR family transcriptional regulator
VIEAVATKRDARRVETARRLRRCALELTRDHGFDGWTMDDLAERAEISRRTVFNYFDHKVDVVLGPEVEVGPDALALFLEGGPTGRLVDDLVELATEFLQEQSVDLDLARLGRSVVLREPRLMALVHERFESRCGRLVELIRRREGADFGVDRAALLIRLLVTVFDAALVRTSPEGTRPFATVFTETVADARALLHP